MADDKSIEVVRVYDNIPLASRPYLSSDRADRTPSIAAIGTGIAVKVYLPQVERADVRPLFPHCPDYPKLMTAITYPTPSLGKSAYSRSSKGDAEPQISIEISSDVLVTATIAYKLCVARTGFTHTDALLTRLLKSASSSTKLRTTDDQNRS